MDIKEVHALTEKSMENIPEKMLTEIKSYITHAARSRRLYVDKWWSNIYDKPYVPQLAEKLREDGFQVISFMRFDDPALLITWEKEDEKEELNRQLLDDPFIKRDLFNKIPYNIKPPLISYNNHQYIFTFFIAALVILIVFLRHKF